MSTRPTPHTPRRGKGRGGLLLSMRSQTRLFRMTSALLASAISPDRQHPDHRPQQDPVSLQLAPSQIHVAGHDQPAHHQQDAFGAKAGYLQRGDPLRVVATVFHDRRTR